MISQQLWVHFGPTWLAIVCFAIFMWGANLAWSTGGKTAPRQSTARSARSGLIWVWLVVIFTMAMWGANLVLGFLLFRGHFRGNIWLGNVLGPTLTTLAAWGFVFVSPMVNHKGSHGHWPSRRQDWHDIAGRSWRLVLVVAASAVGPVLGVFVRNWYIASVAATNDAAIAIVYLVPSVLVSRVILHVTQAWVLGSKIQVRKDQKKAKRLRQIAGMRGKSQRRPYPQHAGKFVWLLRLLFIVALAVIFALWIPITFFRVGAVKGQAAVLVIRILGILDLVVTACITVVATTIACLMNARTRRLKGALFSRRITRRDGKFARSSLKQMLLAVIRTEVSYYLGFGVGGEYSALFPGEPALTSDVVSWVQQIVSTAMDQFRVHLNGRDSRRSR